MNPPNKSDVNLGGSLEDWLESQISRHLPWFRERDCLLDIGAYHGDFACRFLEAAGSPFLKAVLFEPNPESMEALQKRFGGDARITLAPLACSNQVGKATLHCQGEAYTGSILDYQTERSGPKREHAVAVTTVDEYLRKSGRLRPGLIKLDTQGNDLRVLEGATSALQTLRPWLVVEMLATPRFVHQASPALITAFLEERRYFVAAVFNEYYTETGWLAWYDACFVPQELFAMDIQRNAPRPSLASAPPTAPGGWRGTVSRMLAQR